jgi:FkbM family methyltransferase
MSNILKRKIKNIKPLFNSILWVLKFFNALSLFKLNTSSLREFKVWNNDGQELSEYNYRFYNNFINSVVLNSNKKFHFIDIGANDGWFARVIFRFAPKVNITSYEPLISQHHYLESMESVYPNFKFKKYAVGNNSGTIEIREFGTSGLSSIKEINSEYNYSNHFSQTIINKYNVNLVRLDDDLKLYKNDVNETEMILKVDTQGYELEVLMGAQNLLSSGVFKWVIIELMTVEKYKGGHLYNEICDFLHKLNFKLWDINQSYYEVNTNRLSEFDAIFILDI